MALGLSGDNLSEAPGNGFRVLGFRGPDFFLFVDALFRLHETDLGLPLGVSSGLGLRV